MSSGYHLAQLNAAVLLAPIDDPKIADFVGALEQINALAEATPGFVWRLQTEDGDATSIRISDDPHLVVNMSVWEDVDALYQYVYKSNHTDFFSRRREWFKKWDRPSPVLWWIAANHRPTIEEALEKIAHIEDYGPTPFAFNFKQRFSVEDMLSYSSKRG